VVDDDDSDGSFRRFQLQAHLLLDRGEQIGLRLGGLDEKDLKSSSKPR
jgi:hypothetical protein